MNSGKTSIIKHRPLTFVSLRGNGRSSRSSAKHTFIISYGNDRFLVDPGNINGESSLPRIDNLKAVIITHAHFDHFGNLLEVLKQCPTITAYCTRPTKQLITQVFSRRLPYRDHSQLHQLMERVVALKYRQRQELTREVTVSLNHAGHMLGSAACIFDCPDGKILVTGDFSPQPRGVLTPFAVPDYEYRAIISDGSFVGMERPDYPAERNSLLHRVQSTLESGHNMLVPVDALGLAQEFILYLAGQMEAGKLRKSPIFCVDFLKDPNDARQSFMDLSTRNLILSHVDFFSELYVGFREQFGNRRNALRNYFGSLIPLGADFDPTFLQGAIFMMPTQHFKYQTLFGFHAKKFARQIIAENGILLLNKQHFHKVMLRRLSLQSEYRSAVLAPPSADHPYADDIINTVRAATPNVTILVHGRRSDLTRVAAASKNNKVLAPGINEEVPL
ncbi:MAG: MBL fold metallo-hydrolase [Candidatus Margulisbacteria bacterium]|nr:MBL fold metallo-hydrolase [Candidatus Margulisiibacteriota bacterium]MBU1021187.1 MBL fold metallo-hydrolase [Candidatus Margulisiibacteriota bacterium]MBU1729793.1 MBL fold metallo-hydrolase [Candidatus Margulisiibacteriota bacterium]MBU1955294.1 MBL fold metallo-hydrolase [Candidatus Margulisiibacteriota bacterium]